MEPEVDNVGRIVICSPHTTEKVFLLFVNGTSRIVSIYWADFRGILQFYCRFLPDAVVEINTYQGHAFIFCDDQSGERLQVQRQSIFWAKPYFATNPRNEVVPARKRLVVHFPLRSLREHTLWYVARHLKSASENAVNQFDLPTILKDDLKLMLRKLVSSPSSANRTPIVNT